MGVANDGGARRLFLAEFITGDYTVSFWLRRTGDTNTFSSFFDMGGTFPTSLYIGTDGTGTDLDWIPPGDGEQTPGYTWSTNWQYVTCIGDTAVGQNNTIRIYDENMVEQLSDSANSAAGYAGNRIELLNDVDNEPADAIIASVKMWDAQLSEREAINEGFYYTPLRSLNLWSFWPLFNINEINDFSSNGRNLTANGSPTTDDGSPILWAPNKIRSARPDAAAAPPIIPPVVNNTIHQYSFMHN